MLRGCCPGAEIGDSCTAAFRILPAMDVIATLPVLAAGFAIPQFVPQIVKLRITNDTAGDAVGASDWHQQRSLVRLLRRIALLVRVAPLLVGCAARGWSRHHAQPTSQADAPQQGDDRSLDHRARRRRERRSPPARRHPHRRLPHPGCPGRDHRLPHTPPHRHRTRYLAPHPRGGVLLGDFRRCPARRATHHPRHHRRGQRPVDVEPNPNHPTRCGVPWSVAERSDLPTTSPAAVP